MLSIHLWQRGASKSESFGFCLLLLGTIGGTILQFSYVFLGNFAIASFPEISYDADVAEVFREAHCFVDSS